MGSRSARLGRRQFLKGASAAALGAAASLYAPAAVAQELGTQATDMPRRRLGRTNLEISALVIGEVTDHSIFHRAWQMGVNYWHKFGNWDPPEFFKQLDRDSFYCDAVVDTLDYDGAVAQFEWFCKKTGLEKIDFFKLHSPYQNAGDVRRNDQIFRAFDYLKRQGKCDYLAIAQHGRVAEVLEACIETGHFDAIQPPINVLSPPEVWRMIDRAKAADVGIIAKKTLCGGPRNWPRRRAEIDRKIAPHLKPGESLAKALIKYALRTPGVAAVSPWIENFSQLQEDAAAIKEGISEGERQALEEFRREMAGAYCTMCGTCTVGCPQGVAVPDILRFTTYAEGYAQPYRARALYAQLPPPERAAACRDCGQCERACPGGLPVRQMLREAHTILA